MIFGINTTRDTSKLSQISIAFTYTNIEISLMVFMPNITANHSITYTNFSAIHCIGIQNTKHGGLRELRPFAFFCLLPFFFFICVLLFCLRVCYNFSLICVFIFYLHFLFLFAFSLSLFAFSLLLFAFSFLFVFEPSGSPYHNHQRAFKIYVR